MQALALPSNGLVDQTLEWLQNTESLNVLLSDSLILIGKNVRLHLTGTELAIVHWLILQPARFQGKLSIYDRDEGILLEFRGPSVEYRLESQTKRDNRYEFLLYHELVLNGNPYSWSHQVSLYPQMPMIVEKLKAAKRRFG